MIAIAPLLAVGGAALGFMGQRSAQASQERAAREANRIETEKAEAQFARAQQEYELSWQQTLTEYYWTQAATEEARRVQSQAALDQASQGSRLIWNAAETYTVNSQALYQKYVVEEGLRAQQVGMEYQQNMAQFGFKNYQITNEARQAVNQYLVGVLKNGLEAQRQVDQAENKVDELMTQLTSQEMNQNFEYNARVIGAMMDQATQQAQLSATKSGGGKVAKQMALTGMKEALATYAPLKYARQQRAALVGQVNSYLTGDVAKALGALAVESAGYEIQAGLRIGQANTQLKMNASEAAYATSVFEKLTMPSFGLVNQQYGRELRALSLQTAGDLFNATLPYRQTRYPDALYPTKGIAPTYYAPTPVNGPSGGFLAGITSAISGANSLAPGFLTETVPNWLDMKFSNLGGGAGLSAANNWATAGVASNLA